MTTLTFTSRTDKQVTLALAAGGGETVFEVEINRAADFSADESMIGGGISAGAVGISGLPSDTTFFFRARATNTNPKGAWSNVIMQATSAVAMPGYTGYSIEPAILVVPEEVDQLTSAQTDAGSSPANLANDDPMSVWRASAASLVLTFHTPGRAFDTLALLGTMANDDATWRIRGADTLAAVTAAPLFDTGVVALRSSVGIGRRPFYHAYRRLAQAYTASWFRIDITHNAAQFFARNLVIGLARQSKNYSRGAGQTPLDFGSMGRTQFGAPDRVEGWRGRQVDFAISWMNETEYQTKWADLDTLVGNTKPVLVLPNPKANSYLNDRIAFGDIVNSRGENVRDSKWSKTLEIRSIY